MSDVERQEPEWLQDPNIIVFDGERPLAIGAADQHGLVDWVGTKFGKTKDDVKADWDRRLSQVRDLLAGVVGDAGQYEIAEVSVSLGFSAEGQLVFVAKAGVQTTISVKFTRKPAS